MNMTAMRTSNRSEEVDWPRLHKRVKKFYGSIAWYAETVKLDLEARKLIERTSSKPQKYRLKST